MGWLLCAADREVGRLQEHDLVQHLWTCAEAPSEQVLAELGLRCAADVEFGKAQARDLLQHLWTGPISNAPVDILQGSKSVEVRPVGVSKVCSPRGRGIPCMPGGLLPEQSDSFLHEPSCTRSCSRCAFLKPS